MGKKTFREEGKVQAAKKRSEELGDESAIITTLGGVSKL